MSAPMMTETKTQAELHREVGDCIGKARGILYLCEIAHGRSDVEIVGACVQNAMDAAMEQLSDAWAALDQVKVVNEPGVTGDAQ